MSNPTELPDLDHHALGAGTIIAGPIIAHDIVMHGLRITKDGIIYNGQEIKDAGAVHAALMEVLNGRPLPARAQPEGEAPQAEPFDLNAVGLPVYLSAQSQGAQAAGERAMRDLLSTAVARAADLSTAGMGFAASLVTIDGPTIKGVDYLPRNAVMEKIHAWRAAFDAAEKFDARGVRAALAAKAEAPTLTPLEYREQGREEALAVILGQSSEDPFSDCIGWSKSGAPDDEGGAYWKEDELRKLLHIGDRKHDAYDRAEAAYWEALGRKDEAERELLFAKQAPFYKPLHDFLSKHEAWDLMGDLKRAQQAAAPGALLGYIEEGHIDHLRDAANQREGCYIRLYAVPFKSESQRPTVPLYVSAPGTPEAPAEPIAWMDPTAGCVMDAFLWQKDPSNPQYSVPVYTRAAQLDGGQGDNL